MTPLHRATGAARRFAPCRALLVALALLPGCEVTADPARTPEAAAETAAGAEGEGGNVVSARSVEPVAGAAIPLWLPTGNDGLLTGDPAAFYQGVNRDTIGELRTAAWEAGQYGFVRDPVPTPSGPTFRRLHEGLDIRPLHRDAAGEPLDTVRAVAEGRVAYVSAGPGSYGEYVVVEHAWSGSPVYSLYAHLDSAAVAVGDPVAARAPLGRLGYTGRGINRERAHVHLEVALMLNRHAPLWFAQYVGMEDFHGAFYGTNLAGVDVAALYRATRYEPALAFPEFVRAQPPGYRLLLPGERPLDLLSRYPWLLDEGADAAPDAARAWVVTFTRAGVPIRVGRRAVRVTEPVVDGVARAVSRQHRSTNRMLQRTDAGYELTTRGRQYAALLATTAEGPPAW